MGQQCCDLTPSQFPRGVPSNSQGISRIPALSEHVPWTPLELRWLGIARWLLSAPRCPSHLWHCQPVPHTAHTAAVPHRTHGSSRLPGPGHRLGPRRRLVATSGPRQVTAAPGEKSSVQPVGSENWEPSALDSPAHRHFPELTHSGARRVPGESRGERGRQRRKGISGPGSQEPGLGNPRSRGRCLSRVSCGHGL